MVVDKPKDGSSELGREGSDQKGWTANEIDGTDRVVRKY